MAKRLIHFRGSDKPDGRSTKATPMFTTIVAVLCHLSGPAAGACVEEIVSDSSLDPEVTFQGCMIQGQAGIAKWMSEHPIYRSGWRLHAYKCAPGHYEIHGRA